ncbi:hypothetical protein KKF63_01690 [bacterium]|nr:hypothetical protein [bacterium]
MQNINYIPPSDPMFSALGPVETWDDDARTFYAQSQPNAEAKAKAQDIVTIDTDSALPVDEQIHQNLFKLWREEHLTLIPIPSARLGGSAQVAGNLEDHTSQLRGSSATARAPEPMSPDVDLSLKAAFSRVKQFQLDLYLAQIQNIDAMLSPSDPQASYDNLTVHLLSAFLRDVCLDTGLVDLPHLTAAIQEFGNCQENTAKALAQGIKTDFWEMLGELNVSSEDIEQMRRDYHSEHVYRESQEHDALWIDTVTKEFIGRLYYIDQEAFTTSMNAASDVHGVERIRDVFEAQRTCLKSLASLVRQQNNPAQIAELIYCYEDQGTWEYVFDEVIGMDAGIMYQISQTPDKRPPGATHEEWVLARQIQRYHENPDLGDASLGQQIWSVIKYYPPLMLVDWTVADTEQGPLAHAWGSIRDDFDRLRADGSQHLVQEIHDTKIEEKPLEPETVYEPAQPTATPGVMTTASAEFKSLFPLGNPVTDPLEQLSIVRDTMAPGFEASKLLLHNMALTGTFGKGAQIPNFVVHLFKLALITYSEFDATPDATSERTRMQKALERFMMLLFGYDDDNTNLAQYFVNAFPVCQ